MSLTNSRRDVGSSTSVISRAGTSPTFGNVANSRRVTLMMSRSATSGGKGLFVCPGGSGGGAAGGGAAEDAAAGGAALDACASAPGPASEANAKIRAASL
jgi:hypothetical protein